MVGGGQGEEREVLEHRRRWRQGCQAAANNFGLRMAALDRTFYCPPDKVDEDCCYFCMNNECTMLRHSKIWQPWIGGGDDDDHARKRSRKKLEVGIQGKEKIKIEERKKKT